MMKFLCMNKRAWDWIHPPFLLVKKEGEVIAKNTLLKIMRPMDTKEMWDDSCRRSRNWVTLSEKAGCIQPIIYHQTQRETK